jgi:superfamily II DNA or RNA helicase
MLILRSIIEIMKPGTRVRIIANPALIGVTTGRKRERGGNIKWQVQFPSNLTYVLESQLEAVDEHTSMDPVDLLEEGQFGRAKDLRGNLTYIRLNGRLANLIYSMETTNTEFYPYQFKPVLQFLESPSNGLLIADEVGLGKTIEAGLIWTELRSRFDVRRLMVLCPAMLREKWELELSNRFGIDAKKADATEVYKQFQEKDQEFALISSMQGLRPRKGWDDDDPEESTTSKLARLMQDNEHEEPLIDLLIIDESHYMRNPASMTAKLGEIIRSVTNYIVLLSATPINLRSADLFHQLKLVDPDTFTNPDSFENVLLANEPLLRAKDAVMQRKVGGEELMGMLQEAQSHPFLQNNRQLMSLIEDPPNKKELSDDKYRSELADKLEKINLLGRAVTRTRKREVTEWQVIREPIREEIKLTDEERQFYDNVTALVREYCLKEDVHEGFLLATPQRQISSSMPAALRAWKDRCYDDDTELYEDFGDDSERKFGPLVQTLVDNASELGNLNVLWKNDSKYHRLLEILHDYLKRFPEEKIVLFSYFKPTLYYLEERLSKDNIACQVLTGDTKGSKQTTIDKFRNSKITRILLASEVATEGVDLQFSRLLINYDLPWNPMKVEQRIGRIDRLGQRSPKITIWNLFYGDTIDSRIYRRLYERLDIFRRALGGLEAVLGEEIRKLTSALLGSNLTSEQEGKRIQQAELALANLAQQESQLEEEANNLIAHGGYILNQVRAAKELNRCIKDEDLWVYISDFFNKTYTGCEFKQLERDKLIFEVLLSNDAKIDFDHFLREHRLVNQTRLTSNRGKSIKCHFLNKTFSARYSETEIISQFHPIVRFASEKIKESDDHCYPVVSISLNKDKIPGYSIGVYVFSVKRWSVHGTRDIEKLNYVVTEMKGKPSYLSEDNAETLITTAGMYGEDWIAARNTADLSLAKELALDCIDESEKLYDLYIEQIKNENEDRAELQRQSLTRHRDRQMETLAVIKETHTFNGRTSLVKATQGRIDALENRITLKLTEIERQKKLSHYPEDICIGLIKII